jgi:hypothetical protein
MSSSKARRAQVIPRSKVWRVTASSSSSESASSPEVAAHEVHASSRVRARPLRPVTWTPPSLRPPGSPGRWPWSSSQGRLTLAQPWLARQERECRHLQLQPQLDGAATIPPSRRWPPPHQPLQRRLELQQFPPTGKVALPDFHWTAAARAHLLSPPREPRAP